MIVISFLVIFFAKMIDLSLETIRTILVVHNRKVTAFFVGFVEALIFISVITFVLRSVNTLSNIIAYAAGFAAGTYLGTYLEFKLEAFAKNLAQTRKKRSLLSLLKK